MKKTLKPFFGLAVAAGLIAFGTIQSEAQAKVINASDLHVTMEDDLINMTAADWYFAFGSDYVLVVHY
ncbi:hypothetical protein [Sphingobacterium populi]|uniref:Uncharacterized protein n=1 Tax=Sphingobacterium populi TaxID=1812824 RepID=A0ABW5UAC9_9SPHI